MKIYSLISGLYRYFILIVKIIKDIFKNGINLKLLNEQIISIGLNSLPIITLTGLFTGMVLALQTAYGLERFGAKNYVGNIVGLSMLRELGPVLTAIMVCGRNGAGIAAEISSMVVTEQIDALRALGANPISKLATPRVIAGIITLPILTMFANVIGIFGGILVAVNELGITIHQYYHSIIYTVVIRDITDGLIKASLFGLLITSIACFFGFKTKGGTSGVGKTTTEAVVVGSIVIFISDYFITKLLIVFS